MALGEVRALARAAGLEVVECEFRESSVVNAKLALTMRRVLVHAKLRRPLGGGDVGGAEPPPDDLCSPAC